MAAKFSDGDQDSISDINVVPLVDIILVVLIIFMVTAPMIMKPSINVNLPKAASGDKTTPGGLSVTLATDGRVLLNGAESSLDAIRAAAISELEKNPDVQAIISADKDVPHGQVVSMIDLVKTAGVKKFAISIEKAAQ